MFPPTRRILMYSPALFVMHWVNFDLTLCEYKEGHLCPWSSEDKISVRIWCPCILFDLKHVSTPTKSEKIGQIIRFPRPDTSSPTFYEGLPMNWVRELPLTPERNLFSTDLVFAALLFHQECAPSGINSWNITSLKIGRYLVPLRSISASNQVMTLYTGVHPLFYTLHKSKTAISALCRWRIRMKLPLRPLLDEPTYISRARN